MLLSVTAAVLVLMVGVSPVFGWVSRGFFFSCFPLFSRFGVGMDEELKRAVEKLKGDGLEVTVMDAWRALRPGGPQDVTEVKIECGACGFDGWLTLRELGEPLSCRCGAALPEEVCLEIGKDALRSAQKLPLVMTRSKLSDDHE